MGLSLVLLINIFVGGECYLKFDKFTKLPALADQMCPVDQVDFQTVTISAASCVRKCSETPGCTSLIYLYDNKTCYGIKSNNPFSGTSTPLHGAVFYTLINRVVEFCGMKLWFVTQGVPYDDARLACSAIGSLAKPDTAAKMEVLRAYLLDANCGYNIYDFLVQGKYDVTDGVWEFTDGTPLLQGYWHQSAPESTGAYCVMLWSAVDFAYDDYWCYWSAGFICEYQN